MTFLLKKTILFKDKKETIVKQKPKVCLVVCNRSYNVIVIPMV